MQMLSLPLNIFIPERDWFPWQHIACLAGFIKRTTAHCYMQIIKAFGLVVSEKLFYVFPMTPPGRGLYGPHGHGWQNL